jgi:hypothetical protein
MITFGSELKLLLRKKLAGSGIGRCVSMIVAIPWLVFDAQAVTLLPGEFTPGRA